MSPSTRERIIKYLEQQRKSSAPELAQALGMTRANMRYHLDQLLADGTVEALPLPKDAERGRGRPMRVYRLAIAARPSNLTQLANLLLARLLENASADEKSALVKELAREIAGEEPLPRPLTQRLNRLVEILNARRYQARWEARPLSPHILLRNCPYAAVIAQHPELCRMDTALIENLLEMPVEQLVKMDLDTNKPPACIFTTTVKKQPASS